MVHEKSEKEMLMASVLLWNAKQMRKLIMTFVFLRSPGRTAGEQTICMILRNVLMNEYVQGAVVYVLPKQVQYSTVQHV